MRTNAELFAQIPVLTPERRIWRAVLEQAYLDAHLPREADGSEPVERTLARAFLCTEGPELRLVCDYAEIPRDRVLLWAREYFSRGDPAVPLSESPPQTNTENVHAVSAERIEIVVVMNHSGVSP
jgi:hypothetical protein